MVIVVVQERQIVCVRHVQFVEQVNMVLVVARERQIAIVPPTLASALTETLPLEQAVRPTTQPSAHPAMSTSTSAERRATSRHVPVQEALPHRETPVQTPRQNVLPATSTITSVGQHVLPKHAHAMEALQRQETHAQTPKQSVHCATSTTTSAGQRALPRHALAMEALLRREMHVQTPRQNVHLATSTTISAERCARVGVVHARAPNTNRQPQQRHKIANARRVLCVQQVNMVLVDVLELRIVNVPRA